MYKFIISVPIHCRSTADVATVLLQDGANPNLADLKGRTPLIIAASQGKTSTIQVFIDEPKTDLNFQVYILSRVNTLDNNYACSLTSSFQEN